MLLFSVEQIGGCMVVDFWPTQFPTKTHPLLIDGYLWMNLARHKKQIVRSIRVLHEVGF